MTKINVTAEQLDQMDASQREAILRLLIEGHTEPSPGFTARAAHSIWTKSPRAWFSGLKAPSSGFVARFRADMAALDEADRTKA